MSIVIEIFSSPGCRKCGRVKEIVSNIIEEIDGGRAELRVVNVLDDWEYAVSLGVLALPAIAFDGNLVFNGMPSINRLRAELRWRFSHESDHNRI